MRIHASDKLYVTADFDGTESSFYDKFYEESSFDLTADPLAQHSDKFYEQQPGEWKTRQASAPHSPPTRETRRMYSRPSRRSDWR